MNYPLPWGERAWCDLKGSMAPWVCGPGKAASPLTACRPAPPRSSGVTPVGGTGPLRQLLVPRVVFEPRVLGKTRV